MGYHSAVWIRKEVGDQVGGRIVSVEQEERVVQEPDEWRDMAIQGIDWIVMESFTASRLFGLSSDSIAWDYKATRWTERNIKVYL